jgi:hypothetical protein
MVPIATMVISDIYIAKLTAWWYSASEGTIAGRESISGDRNPVMSILLMPMFVRIGKD